MYATLLQVLNELHPIHSGHFKVDHEHRRQHRQRGQQIERFGAIAGFVNMLDAGFTAQIDRMAALHGTVVNDQNGFGNRRHKRMECRHGFTGFL